MTMRAAYVVSRKWRGAKFELLVRVMDDDGNPESLIAESDPFLPQPYTPKLYLAMDMEEKIDWSGDGDALEPWTDGLCKFEIPWEATKDFPAGGCDMLVTIYYQGEEWPVLRSRLGILGWKKD